MIPAVAPLAVAERAGFDESLHFGMAAVVAPDGEVVETHGDADAPFLPRSTLKPLFAASMLALGLEIPQRSLALVAASHAREAMHLELAIDTAALLGVEEDALTCPPMHSVDSGSVARRFSNVCVGKHIAQAATARSFDDDRSYVDQQHPLQQRLRSDIESMTGVRVAATAPDGCGAPVYSTSVIGLARAYRGLVVDTEHERTAQLRQVGAAMIAHPTVVEGSRGQDSRIIEVTAGIAKFGAEGSEAIVAPDGTTAVVKIIDGGRRAAALVALSMLQRLGAIRPTTVEELGDALRRTILGGGVPVGELRSLV